jgi:predicted Zn-dependent protease
MSLEPFVKKALRAALAEGASEAEVYGSRARSLLLYVDDGMVKNVEERMDQGLAVRAIRSKKVGQSSITLATIRDAETCAQTALRLANVSAPDPVFKRFAPSIKGNPAPITYDKDIASLSQESICSLAKDIVYSAMEGGEVKVPSGIIRAAVSQNMVLNTSGAETEGRSTMLYIHFTAMTEGTDPGEGVRFHHSNRLAELDPASFGAGLRASAQDAQKAEHFRGQESMTVILPPNELADLLLSSVAFSLSAENVNKQRSAWAKRMGERVGSVHLNLVDDPFDERGVCSSGYDDEGAPTQHKVLVDRGVLKGFMYDQYNALLSGRESTGNALRRDPTDPQNAYRRPIDIDPINLVWEPGSKRLEGMIMEVERGILVDKLASAEVNPITGAFGLEVRCAKEIVKGEVVRTIDHALLVGNFYQALMGIRDVGREQTVVRNCVLPHVAFEQLEVIGS